MRIEIFTDGGITGDNKEDQPCFFAYVAHSDGNRHCGSKSSIGKGTSNQAEYRGLILALEDIDYIIEEFTGGELVVGKIDIAFVSDSKIMVNQVNGTYKTKDAKLKILRDQVKSIIDSKPGLNFSFTHTKREGNSLTDLLCNLAKKNIIKTDSKQTLTNFKQQHNLEKYKALKGI